MSAAYCKVERDLRLRVERMCGICDVNCHDDGDSIDSILLFSFL